MRSKVITVEAAFNLCWGMFGIGGVGVFKQLLVSWTGDPAGTPQRVVPIFDYAGASYGVLQTMINSDYDIAHHESESNPVWYWWQAPPSSEDGHGFLKRYHTGLQYGGYPPDSAPGQMRLIRLTYWCLQELAFIMRVECLSQKKKRQIYDAIASDGETVNRLVLRVPHK